MARYATSGLHTLPVAFATAFYGHYPKVSIGHWPPVFYGVEAAWMLLVSASRASVMALMAAVTAGLATLLAFAALRHGRAVAAGAALAFVALPLVRDATAFLLLDVFVALPMLAAALALGRYWRRPRWGWSAAFGVLASLAIMTKGNGLALSLLPALLVMLSGRYDLLRRASFWLPVPIVLVACGPWYWATYALAHDGFFYDWGLGYSRMAGIAYAGFLRDAVGWPALALAAWSLVAARTAREQRLELPALILAVFVFQVAIPVDLQARYLLPAIGPVILLAVAGAEDLARRATQRFPRIRIPALLVPALFACGALVAVPAVAVISPKPGLGMQEAARSVMLERPAAILVAGGAPGEGAFVAEVAILQPEQPPQVVRGTKFLGAADFNGGRYVARFAAPVDVAASLRAAGLAFVVIDTAPESLRIPHVALVLQAADEEAWPILRRIAHDGLPGETILYRVPGASIVAAACVWQPVETVSAKPIPTCP